MLSTVTSQIICTVRPIMFLFLPIVGLNLSVTVMGIKGFYKFINRYAPGSINKIKLSNLKGKTLAIDASQMLYQFKTAFAPTNQDFSKNGKSDINNSRKYLGSMCRRLFAYKKMDINIVVIFDGKPPDDKAGELQLRKTRRVNAKSEYEVAISNGEIEMAKKIAPRCIFLDEEDISCSKKLFEAFGIPCIFALGEAEAECGNLVKNNLALGTITNDSDALLFGSKFVYRTDNKDLSVFTEISLESLLETLKLDESQLIDLGILAGCDYCDTIESIGIFNGYKMIKKHTNIENILENIDKKRVPDQSKFDYINVRKLFSTPIVTRIQDISLSFKPVDIDQIALVLESIDWNKVSIDRLIDPIKKNFSPTIRQPNITQFFTKKIKKDIKCE